MSDRGIVVLLALVIAGCATTPAGSPVRRSVLVPNSEYSSDSGRPLYRVWYGTNRKPADPAAGSEIYTGEIDDVLHYGTCYVEVPTSHRFGSVGSSWIRRVITGTDDRLRFAFHEKAFPEQFFRRMRQKLASRDEGKRKALVYIHGYNVNFEEAAIRAAQIGTDLKVEGITAFFSWPSKDNLFQYTADGDSLEASEEHLEEFLLRMLKESDAEEVHVLAHSMGNQGLLRSIARVADSLRAQDLRFGQIFLAAPDVNVKLFERFASVYPSVSARTTLYVSAKDLALESSGIVNDYPRAGFYPPITVIPGIDTIKVSSVDMTLLGHSYFAETHAVLCDMYALMNGDVEPRDRTRLKPVTLADKNFWSLKRSRGPRPSCPGPPQDARTLTRSR